MVVSNTVSAGKSMQSQCNAYFSLLALSGKSITNMLFCIRFCQLFWSSEIWRVFPSSVYWDSQMKCNEVRGARGGGCLVHDSCTGRLEREREREREITVTYFIPLFNFINLFFFPLLVMRLINTLLCDAVTLLIKTQHRHLNETKLFCVHLQEAARYIFLSQYLVTWPSCLKKKTNKKITGKDVSQGL